jgi:hypothetical protein
MYRLLSQVLPTRAWNDLLVAQVDPDDDSIDRGVVWWYRFDPEHNCRRNIPVAAYDNDAEWQTEVRRLQADIRQLQADGASDEKEHAGGSWLPRGYRGEIAARRWTSPAGGSPLKRKT